MNGRRMEFHGDGSDFSASREAERFIRSKGWSVGSMQRDAPRAIFKDGALVAKWRNLSAKDREEADGQIEPGSGRHGPVVIVMKEAIE